MQRSLLKGEGGRGASLEEVGGPGRLTEFLPLPQERVKNRRGFEVEGRPCRVA